MAHFKDFTEDAKRFLINLRAPYEQWVEAKRFIAPGRLQWKGPTEYPSLYRMFDGNGNGTSLGPRSPETEELYATHQEYKALAKSTWEDLLERYRQYNAFRFPKMMDTGGELLREMDVCGFLGSVQVVGTNALHAYLMEAQVYLVGDVTATRDFDLSWTNKAPDLIDNPRTPSTLFEVLKRVDGTYTINSERPFQARNAKSDEVEMLIAPSLEGKIPPKEKFRSIPLEEQEWLLLGDPVEQLLYDTNNKPLRIVAPDPRYFALQKLWLADKPSRDPLKKDKDRTQGELVLHLVHLKMPHYPLNERFEHSLPEPLKPYFEQWKNTLSVPSKHKM